ncbi:MULTISPECIES: hypothetical protein [Halobacterium]|uniref:hypothetical protein n=1 Tax=Halobacterium TaxID=2239 RepID=UPI00073FA179|nr:MULTISPECIES: hypothetical protein [Halobacterium]MCG1003503.1 hypothetical protein [Halobacterium noricense]
MRRPDADTLQRVVLGERRPRRVLLATVVAVLALASVAFLAGFDVRLYDFSGWLVVVPAIAIGAGVARAGLLSGIGSLWLVALWGYVFPPLVGYLTGEWTEAGRYTHPRMLGFAYGSARAELVGGVETALDFGLMAAVALGVSGYALGAAGRWAVERAR